MTQVQIDAVRKLNEANVKQLRNKRDFIVPFLRTALSSFSEQSEEFAAAVMAGDKSLEGCVNALKVPQGDRVSLSDFDVYRMAVQYFFDGADVEWSMKISMPKSQSTAKTGALEINVIKQQTARNMLSAAVEIGRLLCEAKEKVGHGTWGQWLAENVSYSVSTANNMMRLYNERESMAQLDMFSSGGWEMFEGMSPTKVLALLDVPAHERREFIEETGAANEDTSVADVKAAIKAKKEAEERARAAEEREQAAAGRADAAEAEKQALADKLEASETQLKLMQSVGVTPEERAKIEKEAAEKAKADADKKIAAAKKKAEKDLEKAKKEGADAVKKVEAEREAEIERAREEARAAAERESAAKIAALEEKLKAQVVAASPHMERFKAHLVAFQEAYRRMLDVVHDAEGEAPEVAATLKRAMSELTARLTGGQ